MTNTSRKPTILKFDAKNIALKDLLLDPNNYRFLDNKGYKPKPKTKYASDRIQNSTLRLLIEDKRYQLSELTKSILTNGYVPMERIIVAPYPSKQGKYIVVEGNRRVAALKSILQDEIDGSIDLSQEEKDTFSTIPCAVLNVPAKDRTHAERIIMGIRHITGPREWGAYQQAQLVKELHDQEGQDFASIGEHLGISTVEVARRYRAMTALKSMETDDLYSEKAEPEFYRLFHELVSLPDVRVRFGWNSELNRFDNEEKAREFFELIAPQAKEAIEPKLKAFSDVRKLKLIVGNLEAEEILLDPTKAFSEALAEVSQGSSKTNSEKIDFSEFLKSALDRVKSMTRQELKNLSSTDKKTIKSLIKELEEIHS